MQTTNTRLDSCIISIEYFSMLPDRSVLANVMQHLPEHQPSFARTGGLHAAALVTTEGQFVVASDTITVLTGQATQRQCPPERAQGDEQLLTALSQVTNWRRRGDTLELIGGPRTLRFKVPTN